MDALALRATVLARLADSRWDFMPTDKCRFEVAVNGGPFSPATAGPGGAAVFTLPATPRPLPLIIKAVPTTDRHWPVAARFEYRGHGELVNLGTDLKDDIQLFEPAAFQPPAAVTFPNLPQEKGTGGGRTATAVLAYLSRLKDVSDRVLQEINVVPDKFKHWAAQGWLPEWRCRPLDGVHLISERMLDDAGRLDFGPPAPLEPDMVSRVFEVGGVKAPKLLAVSWPGNVPTHRFAGPTPFQIYYHPSLGQSGNYLGQPYPYGWAYLFFIAYRDSHWIEDPMTRHPGPKGLAHQLAATRKGVVLVVPVSRLGGAEFGTFTDAEEVEGLLREIQAFMFRRNAAYRPAGLGRVAISAFSNGCGGPLRELLQRNRGHALLRESTREIYLFDPRTASFGLVQEILSWAKETPEDRRVRVYLSQPDSAYGQLLGKALPRAPFIESTADGQRTVAVTRLSDWSAAAARLKADPEIVDMLKSFGPVHELHAGTLSVHALKQSGFK